MNTFYSIISISDGIYRITSCEGVFMELFVGEHHALLFDTGMGYGDLRGCVRSITDLPLYIVNSHGHPDHMGGNFLFDEPVYIHPEDIPLLMQYNSTRSEFLPDEQSRTSEFDEQAYINAAVNELIPVHGGHIFDLGGLTLETLELPGHTPGSIGLLCRETRTLYASDAINGWVWLFLEESLPLSVYRATLRKASAIDFDLMYTGHGPVPEPKETFAKFIETADGLDYENGIPYTDVPPPYRNGDVRICLRPGYSLTDRENPGFAAVVIEQSKL